MGIENFINKVQEKIEKNSFKAEMTYEKNGEKITELVYLKRSLTPLGDWKRIYPVIKDLPSDELENIGDKWWKKVNWTNLIWGGKRNLIKLILVLVLVGLFFLAFKEISWNYQSLANLPCVKSCLEVIKYG